LKAPSDLKRLERLKDEEEPPPIRWGMSRVKGRGGEGFFLLLFVVGLGIGWKE